MILLDTHVVVWLSSGTTGLSRHANSAIRRARRADGLAISAISLWELAWLTSRGRVEVSGTLEEYLQEVTSRITVLPITARVAIVATELPADFSSDPCDRVIGATALTEGIPLVTKNSGMRNCGQLRTIW